MDTTLADVFSLLSLFFLTIGRTKECPAIYSQVASIRVSPALISLPPLQFLHIILTNAPYFWSISLLRTPQVSIQNYSSLAVLRDSDVTVPSALLYPANRTESEVRLAYTAATTPDRVGPQT